MRMEGGEVMPAWETNKKIIQETNLKALHQVALPPRGNAKILEALIYLVKKVPHIFGLYIQVFVFHYSITCSD